MDEVKGTWLTLLAGIGLTGLLLLQLSSRYTYPFAPMISILNTPVTDLQDVAGVALGIRRLTADLAWVQTLQYYGTQEPGQSEFEFENGIGRYPLFLSYCQRVTGIDPYFTYVYYYGGGVLGWNLNRLSEAEELLKQGIVYNPHEWRLPQYLAALAYQKNHNVKDLIRFLELIAQDPQCPLMMQVLLANLYKKQGLYTQALHTWERIYENGDPNYQKRAIEQFESIRRLKPHLHP